jgi:hypothetical protein
MMTDGRPIGTSSAGPITAVPAAGGAFLSAAECWRLLRAAVVAAAKEQHDNGGAPLDPGFLALLNRLQRGAAAGSEVASLLATVEPRELTTAQAAIVMEVSGQRVRQLAAQQKIIARKAGWIWLVDARAAEDWRDRRRATDGNR